MNKDVSVENISEHNLIARRIIKDHIHHMGGLGNVLVCKEMLDSVSHARKRYHCYLEQKRSEKVASERADKRKNLEEELVQMRRKQKQVEDDIDMLLQEADKLSDKAETTRNMALVVKANSHRRSAKEKKEQLEVLKKSISEKEHSFHYTD